MLKRSHIFGGAIHIIPKNIDKKIVVNVDFLPTRMSCVDNTKYVHLIGSKYDEEMLNIGQEVDPYGMIDILEEQIDWLATTFLNKFYIHNHVRDRLLSSAIVYFLREDYDVVIPLLSRAVRAGEIILYTNNSKSRSQIKYIVENGVSTLVSENKIKNKKEDEKKQDQDSEYIPIKTMYDPRNYNLIRYPFGFTIEGSKENERGEAVGLVKKIKLDPDNPKAVVEALYETCNKIIDTYYPDIENTDPVKGAEIDSLCVNYIYDVVAHDNKDRKELYQIARTKLSELLTKIGLIYEPSRDIWIKK